ncbi:NADH dehydrogenase subunit 5 [Caldifermentibacillus hisashii]|uniref:NADH dehydrogenase subunit 5 n=1 Tax=Caldifermentibacillus hisashii TaxID=996558 RepID=UPI0031365F00
MHAQIEPNFIMNVFFIMIAFPIISGMILLHPKTPLSFLQIHLCLLVPGPIIALLAIFYLHESIVIGPWRQDSLSWVLASFVLTISLILQKFSVRYLFGDRSYRKYFILFTLTTVSNALAWFSDDLRLLLFFFGATLFGLFLLIGLKREWQVAKKAALSSGRMFLISWLFLLAAVIWLSEKTGEWHLSMALSETEILHSWEKTGMNLLLVTAVLIPAAQWPFGKWLLNSVVAPTPVSAIMHAGIVNSGGMLLTRFAPLVQENLSQTVLIVISSFSILIGTGIMLVQVDYKRQLVGSTIAQMGFMLIQCGLGAYAAAITHAVLHGLFKATLFLQSGSVFDQNKDKIKLATGHHSPVLIFIGIILGLGSGIAIWFSSPNHSYQLVSAIILGWSVAFSWVQLVARSNEQMGRFVGGLLFIGTGAVYLIVQGGFHEILHEVHESVAGTSSFIAGVFVLLILTLGSLFSAWLMSHRSSPLYAKVYFWLLRLGEPDQELIESHPKYLAQIPLQGGSFR